ncbi:ComF family protein [Clostridium sp. D2Q-14]|uniref:ComF family protein n=1 Tax=Anaeromonas gelatinilytica TaxID=2683194 RepID=UPI00193BCFAB|nr:ComF family protein [Anaeromonas gelatinilytica]MBS4535791.1 ComF family protein [Anaeromonas gelatinilytica]
MNILELLLELIYPEKNICFICDEYYKGIENYLCNECRNKLPFLDQIVEKDIICPLKYQGIVKELIFKYKYGRNPYLYKIFGEILVDSYYSSEIKGIDIIVPIPLDRRKKASRGFNQSELLAKYISKKINIPIDIKNLIKIKSTRSQSELSKKERRQNIKGVFKVKDSKNFINKNILLVDDIFTTGSTYNEASRVLKSVGCKNTYLITIATGRNL